MIVLISNTDNITSTNTINNTNNINCHGLDDVATLDHNDEEIPDTIEAKINRLIPLVNPYSVINSPIHINTTDHTVRANAESNKTVILPVSITVPPRI